MNHPKQCFIACKAYFTERLGDWRWTKVPALLWLLLLLLLRGLLGLVLLGLLVVLLRLMGRWGWIWLLGLRLRRRVWLLRRLVALWLLRVLLRVLLLLWRLRMLRRVIWLLTSLAVGGRLVMLASVVAEGGIVGRGAWLCCLGTVTLLPGGLLLLLLLWLLVILRENTSLSSIQGSAKTANPAQTHGSWVGVSHGKSA